MIFKKYISLFIWPKSNCFNAFELHDKILFCHFNFKSNAYTSICFIKLSFDRSTPFSRFSDDYLHHVVFCFKVNNWLNNLHVKHNCFSSYPCVAAKANKIGKKNVTGVWNLLRCTDLVQYWSNDKIYTRSRSQTPYFLPIFKWVVLYFTDLEVRNKFKKKKLFFYLASFFCLCVYLSNNISWIIRRIDERIHIDMIYI